MSLAASNRSNEGLSVVESLIRIPRWMKAALTHNDLDSCAFLFKLLIHMYKQLIKKNVMEMRRSENPVNHIFAFLRVLIHSVRPYLCQYREKIMRRVKTSSVHFFQTNTSKYDAQALTETMTFIDICHELGSLSLLPPELHPITPRSESLIQSSSSDDLTSWIDRFVLRTDSHSPEWAPFKIFFARHADAASWRLADLLCDCHECLSLLKDLTFSKKTDGSSAWVWGGGDRLIPTSILPFVKGNLRSNPKLVGLINSVKYLLDVKLLSISDLYSSTEIISPLELLKICQNISSCGIEGPLKAIREAEKKTLEIQDEASQGKARNQIDILITSHLSSLASIIDQILTKVFVASEANAENLPDLMGGVSQHSLTKPTGWREFHNKWRETSLLTNLNHLMSATKRSGYGERLTWGDGIDLEEKTRQLVHNHILHHVRKYLRIQYSAVVKACRTSSLSDVLLARGSEDQLKAFDEDNAVMTELLHYTPLACAYNAMALTMEYLSRWPLRDEGFLTEVKRLLGGFCFKAIAYLCAIPRTEDLFSSSPASIPEALGADFKSSLTLHDDWRHVFVVKQRLLKSFDPNLIHGVAPHPNRRLIAWSNPVMMRVVKILIPFFKELLKQYFQIPNTGGEALSLDILILGLERAPDGSLRYCPVPRIVQSDVTQAIIQNDEAKLDAIVRQFMQ